jgi:hypothetical protein
MPTNKMKQYLQVKYIVPLGIVLLFVMVGIDKCVKTRDLKKNGVLVEAKITDWLGSHKGAGGVNPSYRCEFHYNGKKLSLISGSRVKEKGMSYVGKIYPALYSERTNAIRLLMFPEDFEEYGRKYPDSLESQ